MQNGFMLAEICQIGTTVQFDQLLTTTVRRGCCHRLPSSSKLCCEYLVMDRHHFGLADRVNCSISRTSSTVDAVLSASAI
jgi:hypothetical protein